MLRLNPITQRRLSRFKQLKRAYYSFWLLVALYAIGLLANLICNDRPLYIRYEGKSYFPVMFDYSESAFIPGGALTRAKYKELNTLPVFAQQEHNFMIFPPIPYSPFASTPAESLNLDNTVTVTFNRKAHIATVNLTPEFIITKSQNPKFFFAQQSTRDLRGASFTDYWPIPKTIRTAMQARFANQGAGAINAQTKNSAGTTITVSLSTYKARSRPPRTVRLALRETQPESETHQLKFKPVTGLTETHPFWQNISPQQQATILASVAQRQQGVVPPQTLQLGDITYNVTFEKQDIYFPYPPVGNHYLGLDSSGRDVTARILYALRTSLNFGFVLVIVAMSLGVVIGAIQGYCGGLIDLVSQRLIEIWESLPFLYIIILMGSIYGRSLGLLLFIYCIFNWIGISYYMRGELLKLRKLPFVEAAHCMGIAPVKIIGKHLLPNGIVPIITFFPFSLVGAIGVLAALDYLGFGLPPPTPSWGELLSQYQEFKYAWWLALYPSLSLFIVSLLGAFIGEGVRAAFDPRTNSRIE